MEPAPHLTVFDIRPGSQVGGYTVRGPHRQGGFSTAYEALDSEGRRYELQVFPSGLFETGQASKFRERLLPWKRVQSSSVARVHDLVELGDHGLVLVTEAPPGVSLREVLRERGRLDPELVRGLACQLLDGLEAIHAEGLAHGDIKPHTIHVILNGDLERAILVDGGVTPGLWTAKDLSGRTALIGTPHYAPVEQFGGDAPDVRSDIYNLATVLYESLAGNLPWRGTSFLEVFQAKLKEPPPIGERTPGVEVPADLEAAVLRGCQPDRHKRFSSATEFRSALSCSSTET